MAIAKDEPETILSTPQKEGYLDAAVNKDIADHDLDMDYEGSEPKVELVARDQREVDPATEYAKMEMPRNGTLCERMMPWEVYIRILWVHKA